MVFLLLYRGSSCDTPCNIFLSLSLALKNNLVVIAPKVLPWKYLGKQSQHIQCFHWAMAPREFFRALSASGSTRGRSSNETFKVKIAKPDMFIGNWLHFDKWINQMYIYIEIEGIPAHQWGIVVVLFLWRNAEEWIWLRFSVYYQQETDARIYLLNFQDMLWDLERVYGIINEKGVA